MLNFLTFDYIIKFSIISEGLITKIILLHHWSRTKDFPFGFLLVTTIWGFREFLFAEKMRNNCFCCTQSATSGLQVTFALSAVQGLCVTTADRNFYPLCASARHYSTPIWAPPDSQQEVKNEQRGTTAKTVCVWGEGCREACGGVCPSGLPNKYFKAKTCQAFYKSSTGSICQADQVVIGHLLFITKLLLSEDLATNAAAQALTHDGSEKFSGHLVSISLNWFLKVFLMTIAEWAFITASA